MYTPAPMDTSHIKLDEDLIMLTEKIARNVHEVWAKGRIEDGWVYGEIRDDKARTTPCLIPYDQLSEEERNFDRNTAMETLKFITALGYRIEK